MRMPFTNSKYFTSLFLFLVLQTSLSAQWRNEAIPTYSSDFYTFSGTRYFGYMHYLSGDKDIYTSLDGKNWSLPSPTPPMSQSYQKIGTNGDTIILWCRNNMGNYFATYSFDSGNTWRIGAERVTQYSDFSYFNGRIFIQQSDTSLIYSDDFGTNWQGVAQPVFGNYSASTMLMHQDQIYVRGDSANLYRSSDRGVTWSVFQQPVYQAGESLSEMTFTKTHLLISAWGPNVSLGSGYWSTDKGLTWQRVPMPPNAEGFFRVYKNGFYTSDNTGEVLVTYDQGQTWTISTRLYTEISDNLHVDGSLASFDQGQTWEPGFIGFRNAYTGTQFRQNAHSIDVGSNNQPFYPMFRGVDTSVNIVWQARPAVNYGGTFFQDHETQIYDNSGVLHYSYDDGATWSNQAIAGYQVLNLRGSIIYLKALQSLDYFISQDFGKTLIPLPFASQVVFFYNVDQHVYAIVNGKDVFASTYSAPTQFELLPVQLPLQGYYYTSFADKLFCKKNSSEVYRYDGIKWDTCNFLGINSSLFFPSSNNTSQIVHAGEKMLLLAIESFGNKITLMQSSDGGLNWQNISAQFPTNLRFAALMQTQRHFYLVGYEPSANPLVWSHMQVLSSPISENQFFINGTTFYDLNENGVYDTTEMSLPDIMTKTASSGYFALSATNGRFKMPYFPNVPDTITPILQNKYYYATTPPVELQATPGFDHQIGIGFVPGVTDLCVDLTNIVPFRPGFGSTVLATIQNVGTTPAGCQFMFILNPNVEYIGAAPISATSIQGDTIWFQIPSIAVGEKYVFGITVKTKVTTPIGTNLSINGQAITQNTDLYPLNNSSTIRTLVVGSFDPNDKAVQPEYLHPDQVAKHENLYYTIRFQNTGNYPATFVRILDTLDANLVLETLVPVSASHAYTWSIRDRNVLDVFFNNINLADSVSNEPESHGFVKFAVQADSTLQLGQRIQNSAGIYFDFNEPVITNTVQTEVKLVNTQEPQNQSFVFRVSPNPGKGKFVVTLDTPISEPSQVQVLDASGRTCTSQSFDALPSVFDLPDWTKVTGTYFVQITTQSGALAVQKLVVEF
jgi:uncharacterized repeat protein (TIGR01451 family)